MKKLNNTTKVPISNDCENVSQMVLNGQNLEWQKYRTIKLWGSFLINLA